VSRPAAAIPRHPQTLFVGQGARLGVAQWAAALERRALLAGMPAVINGIDCHPASEEAHEALVRLYGPHLEGETA
jgi:hypothetical protein